MVSSSEGSLQAQAEGENLATTLRAQPGSSCGLVGWSTLLQSVPLFQCWVVPSVPRLFLELVSPESELAVFCGGIGYFFAEWVVGKDSVRLNAFSSMGNAIAIWCALSLNICGVLQVSYLKTGVFGIVSFSVRFLNFAKSETSFHLLFSLNNAIVIVFFLLGVYSL